MEGVDLDFDQRPCFTENFSTNLGDIENFLGAEGAGYFEKLFNRLTDEIVLHVCRFPLPGGSFLDARSTGHRPNVWHKGFGVA